MEAVIDALIKAGPWGIVTAILVLANGAQWIALRATQKAHIEEIRRSSAALYESTDALRESNTSREATASALKALEGVSQMTLGRVERIAALAERIADRFDRRLDA